MKVLGMQSRIVARKQECTGTKCYQLQLYLWNWIELLKKKSLLLRKVQITTITVQALLLCNFHNLKLHKGKFKLF